MWKLIVKSGICCLEKRNTNWQAKIYRKNWIKGLLFTIIISTYLEQNRFAQNFLKYLINRFSDYIKVLFKLLILVFLKQMKVLKVYWWGSNCESRWGSFGQYELVETQKVSISTFNFRYWKINSSFENLMRKSSRSYHSLVSCQIPSVCRSRQHFQSNSCPRIDSTWKKKKRKNILIRLFSSGGDTRKVKFQIRYLG